MPDKIGMFAQPGMIATPRGEGYQFGMYSAAQGAAQALLRHSVTREFSIFCAPPAVEAVRQEVRSVVRDPNSGAAAVTVESLLDLVDPRRGAAPVSAWVDLGGDVVRPHRFRRRIGGSYPIAVVHHSISFGYCLHNWFLPLLVGDVRPCDSVICTSRDAMRAVELTLARVAEGFNREHGTSLSYRGRLDCVPLGVDTDHFKPEPKSAARAMLKISPEDDVVLWAGRISAQDKADLAPLLHAFRDLAQTRPRLRLVLAGAARGDEMQVLGRIVDDLGIRSRTAFLGLVAREHLPTLYSAADVFVSPVDSIQETFGLTVVEAMACGAPVVCSDWGGYRESVVHGETGFLVPTITVAGADEVADDLADWSTAGGDLVDQHACAQTVTVHPGDLRRHLAALVDDPALRLRMGAAGRARAEQVFAWPRVVERYDDLLRGLTDIAPRCRPGGRGGRDAYSRARFAATHGHYPTSRLPPNTVIRATATEPPRDPRPRADTLSQTTLRHIFDDLRQTGPLTIDEVVLRSGLASAPARAAMHVAWLLKYGHVTC